MRGFSSVGCRFVLLRPNTLCPRCAPQRGPMRRLRTDSFVKTAKSPAAGRMEISDMRCAGLVLRIAADGGKSWSFRFRTKNGKQTRATIGAYPDIGLTAARSSAIAMRKDVAEGKDPVEQTRRADGKRCRDIPRASRSLPCRTFPTPQAQQRGRRAQSSEARSPQVGLAPVRR
jgi:hypothetical protein